MFTLEDNGWREELNSDFSHWKHSRMKMEIVTTLKQLCVVTSVLTMEIVILVFGSEALTWEWRRMRSDFHG